MCPLVLRFGNEQLIERYQSSSYLRISSAVPGKEHAPSQGQLFVLL